MRSGSGGRKKTRKWRVLLGITGFVLIFSLGSMLFIRSVYDREFGRKDRPEFSGYLQFSDTEGYEREVVDFPSGANDLKGYLYGKGNDKGLIVLVHGLGGGAENYLDETLYFVDRGWTVFSFDLTGSHGSEGEGTIGLPQSLIDLEAALDYIGTRSDIGSLPLTLYGHSWGGYAVTAILNERSDIRGVVSLAGFNSPMELLAEQAHKMMGPLAYVMYPYEWAYQRMLFGDAAGMTAAEGISRTNTPVLLIHGENDEMISYEKTSIISHREEIMNPNVTYRTSRENGHDGHNDLCLSDRAIAYTTEMNEEYKKLYDTYEGSIPDDVKAAYYEAVDKFRTGELDRTFMEEINRFLENSLVVEWSTKVSSPAW